MPGERQMELQVGNPAWEMEGGAGNRLVATTHGSLSKEHCRFMRSGGDTARTWWGKAGSVPIGMKPGSLQIRLPKRAEVAKR